MNPDYIAQVRSTWQQLGRSPELLATNFYARAFALAPELREHFLDDARNSGERLISLIGNAVESLDRIPALLPQLASFGEHTARSAVRPSHYSALGLAWLSALRSCLGADFTPRTEAAWTAFYGLIARSVRQGTYRAHGISRVA